MRKYKKQIPNALTFLRIVLIPIFIYLAIKQYYLISLLVFIIASLSDTFDGIIARKYNYVSGFGKIFDPIADKLLVASALIILTYWNLIYCWLTVLILVREVFMTVLRFYLFQKKFYLAANILGKIKTTLQFIAIIFSLFYKTFLESYNILQNIILVAFIFIALLGWFSAAIYIIQIRSVSTRLGSAKPRQAPRRKESI